MSAARQKYELQVDGRDLQLSNPDKVLYPSGFTKGQVIDYYIRVSDYVLPYLSGRPITLKRYPNGVEAKHFYEKDAPRFTPTWIRTFPVPRRAGGTPIHYVVIDDLPTLVWCANAANLELHPFLHCAPDIDKPSAMVFDLDPGEGAGVLTCAEVAFLLKYKLDSAGLQSFAKVSGSKGIQIYVPLNTPVSYADTRPYAHALAQELERENPSLVVSEMSKSLRHKKVLMDWSQNSDFKTTVGVYSLRAKRSAPYVSMPVGWDELRAALKSGDASRLDFDPGSALKRLKKLGDLFSPILSLKQKLDNRTTRPKLAASESVTGGRRAGESIGGRSARRRPRDATRR